MKSQNKEASQDLSQAAIIPKKPARKSPVSKDPIKRANQLANLKPIKKGEIRNANGHSQRLKDLKYVRGKFQEIFSLKDDETKETRLEIFLAQMIANGMESANYARLVMEYTYGKPAQEVQVRDLTLEDMFSQALSQFSQGNIPPSPLDAPAETVDSSNIIDVEPTD